MLSLVFVVLASMALNPEENTVPCSQGGRRSPSPRPGRAHSLATRVPLAAFWREQHCSRCSTVVPGSKKPSRDPET